MKGSRRASSLSLLLERRAKRAQQGKALLPPSGGFFAAFVDGVLFFGETRKEAIDKAREASRS